MTGIEFVCEECGSEWTRAIPGGRCPDCNSVLSGTGEDEGESLATFDTANPYLRKLFSLDEFGRAPGAALDLLREVSPDPDEFLLCAIKCGHGVLNGGYLIATTHYLRWIQTSPHRQDDFWTYANPLQLDGHILVTPEGLQFQAHRRAARSFVAIYRVAQQAWNWEESHPDGEAVNVPTSDSSANSSDIAGQLERLAQLLEKN